MDRLEVISRWMQGQGYYLSLRLGPCGQWKVRLYADSGRKVYEAIVPSMQRGYVLALREVERARSVRLAA